MCIQHPADFKLYSIFPSPSYGLDVPVLLAACSGVDVQHAFRGEELDPTMLRLYREFLGPIYLEQTALYITHYFMKRARWPRNVGVPVEAMHWTADRCVLPAHAHVHPYNTPVILFSPGRFTCTPAVAFSK